MDRFSGRFVYFEDTVTYFDKIVMFSDRGKQIDILKFIQLQLFSSEVLMLFLTAELKTLYFVIILTFECDINLN